MIMRHECGHAIQHGYQLQRRREWQRLFGKSSTKYPEAYRPNPASKRYVQHLRRWYAQSHPDEDFAETFAVWLRPRSDWRRRYEGWPALQKLEYVDELMARSPARARRTATGACSIPCARSRTTLGEHYAQRRALYSVEYPKTYDYDLHRLFSDDPKHRRQPHRGELPARASRGDPPHRLALDRRVPVLPRPGAHRHDRTLPGAQAPRRRATSASCSPTSSCCSPRARWASSSGRRAATGSPYEEAPHPRPRAPRPRARRMS